MSLDARKRYNRSLSVLGDLLIGVYVLAVVLAIAYLAARSFDLEYDTPRIVEVQP